MAGFICDSGSADALLALDFLRPFPAEEQGFALATLSEHGKSKEAIPIEHQDSKKSKLVDLQAILPFPLMISRAGRLLCFPPKAALRKILKTTGAVDAWSGIWFRHRRCLPVL